MPHTPDVTQKVFEIIRNAVSVSVLIIIFYILQYIFDMHFLCSCMPGLHKNGILYLLLPPLILTFVVNIVEPSHQREIFYIMHCFSKPGCISHLIWYFFKLILKYVSLTAVWIAIVLFDGDWYFCVMTNLNSTHTGMPCKANLTYEEQRIRDTYITDSLDYGLYLTFGFLFAWNVVEFSKTFRKFCQRCPPYYHVLYKALLEKQVKSHLNEKLKQIATKKARAICQPYLNAIRRHEQLEQNEDSDEDTDEDTDEEADADADADVDVKNISDVWKNISSSSFYWMEHERLESTL